MSSIRLESVTGSFAEDKDAAATLRRDVILPTLEAGKRLEIDFGGIRLTTQSFIHALISEALRRHGTRALELLEFKNCGTAPRGIIETVVQYVLEARDSKHGEGSARE